MVGIATGASIAAELPVFTAFCAASQRSIGTLSIWHTDAIFALIVAFAPDIAANLAFNAKRAKHTVFGVETRHISAIAGHTANAIDAFFFAGAHQTAAITGQAANIVFAGFLCGARQSAAIAIVVADIVVTNLTIGTSDTAAQRLRLHT